MPGEDLLVVVMFDGIEMLNNKSLREENVVDMLGEIDEGF